MPDFTVTVGGLDVVVNRGNTRAAIIAAFDALEIAYALGTHVLIENDQGEAAYVVVARGRQDDPWDEVPTVKEPRGPLPPGQQALKGRKAP
jgi:hypothetical protein